jgi:hypothetical protein
MNDPDPAWVRIGGRCEVPACDEKAVVRLLGYSEVVDGSTPVCTTHAKLARDDAKEFSRRLYPAPPASR